MRALIQRVSHAGVKVDGKSVSEIGQGLLVLVGVCAEDGDSDIDWLVRKIVNLRIFDDDEGVMNRSVLDVGGDILSVSQFTLMASCKKGNRPSYIHAAPGEISEPMYGRFCDALSAALGKPVGRGIFGADMKVSLLNDGPVTIWLDSKNPE
ncbi:MAG: D-tyrosyl-tRNA(Tyr) deacylase [Bacteroidales bacterium]|jgi:D-tyrosyl-tRNA(Tyr) deacylase|nr:D-tyrosyl-tRNA(Tyr) deacylase [Bacteroidales bacterium]